MVVLITFCQTYGRLAASVIRAGSDCQKNTSARNCSRSPNQSARVRFAGKVRHDASPLLGPRRPRSHTNRRYGQFSLSSVTRSRSDSGSRSSVRLCAAATSASSSSRRRRHVSLCSARKQPQLLMPPDSRCSWRTRLPRAARTADDGRALAVQPTVNNDDPQASERLPDANGLDGHC